MEQLMTVLLIWITAHSGYSMPSTLLAVKYSTNAEMRRMHFCDGVAICDEATLPSERDIRINALYNHEERVMYLPKNFNKDEPLNQATLVHELVHHLQALDGKFKAAGCIGHMEAEAYAIKDRWLVAQGLPVPEKSFARIIAESCIPGPT